MNYAGLKDDALTALIHLGYLAYDANRKMAYIPNHEVCNKFIELHQHIW